MTSSWTKPPSRDFARKTNIFHGPFLREEVHIEKTKKIIEELDEISRNRYVSYYYLATVYTSLGELDKAFEYLDLAYEDVDADLVLLNVDSKFDALHSDPRYEALLKKIGLGR